MHCLKRQTDFALVTERNRFVAIKDISQNTVVGLIQQMFKSFSYVL